mmetsp:Transcript_10592/g.29185  ORF Transcript_10592/g.29185 Transcript_10592/m.29185 type:complete len:204 (+) Transcript_10592:936-1547(+)
MGQVLDHLFPGVRRARLSVTSGAYVAVRDRLYRCTFCGLFRCLVLGITIRSIVRPVFRPLILSPFLLATNSSGEPGGRARGSGLGDCHSRCSSGRRHSRPRRGVGRRLDVDDLIALNFLLFHKECLGCCFSVTTVVLIVLEWAIRERKSHRSTRALRWHGAVEVKPGLDVPRRRYIGQRDLSVCHVCPPCHRVVHNPDLERLH